VLRWILVASVVCSASCDEDVDVARECLCADINRDGDVNLADLARLNAILNGSIEARPCDYLTGDILADGELSERDSRAFAVFLGRAQPVECSPCNLTCGDVDGNQVVDAADEALLEDPNQLDGCQWWAANLNGDGTVDQADRDAILAAVGTTPTTCLP
jgi:hypothetical protein